MEPEGVSRTAKWGKKDRSGKSGEGSDRENEKSAVASVFNERDRGAADRIVLGQKSRSVARSVEDADKG